MIEIIAQQTQLDRADQYYKKFIKKFPNPIDMSKSTKREILEMWSGLGYNSRAVRMFEPPPSVKIPGLTTPPNINTLISLTLDNDMKLETPG